MGDITKNILRYLGYVPVDQLEHARTYQDMYDKIVKCTRRSFMDTAFNRNLGYLRRCTDNKEKTVEELCNILSELSTMYREVAHLKCKYRGMITHMTVKEALYERQIDEKQQTIDVLTAHICDIQEKYDEVMRSVGVYK